MSNPSRTRAHFLHPIIDHFILFYTQYLATSSFFVFWFKQSIEKLSFIVGVDEHQLPEIENLKPPLTLYFIN